MIVISIYLLYEEISREKGKEKKKQDISENYFTHLH